MRIHSAKKELIRLATRIGARPDYVQAGGGNMSAKIDERTMIVKSSGLRLREVNDAQGLVAVDYRKVARMQNKKQEQKIEVVAVVGIAPGGRPSIEAGFHAILPHRVILHTHSVYANMLTCSKKGIAVAKKIAGALYPNRWLWIPYCQPGAPLARTIQKKAARHKQKTGVEAQIMFLENHGILVAGKSGKEIHRIHENINREIKKWIGAQNYPTPGIKKIKEGVFENTADLSELIFNAQQSQIDQFADTMLFPDQAVYCQKMVIGKAGKQPEGSIAIDAKKKKILFHMKSEKEAAAAQETIAAWAYITHHLQKAGLELQTIGKEEKQKIENMESEAYRKKLLRR